MMMPPYPFPSTSTPIPPAPPPANSPHLADTVSGAQVQGQVGAPCGNLSTALHPHIYTFPFPLLPQTRPHLADTVPCAQVHGQVRPAHGRVRGRAPQQRGEAHRAAQVRGGVVGVGVTHARGRELWVTQGTRSQTA